MTRKGFMAAVVLAWCVLLVSGCGQATSSARKATPSTSASAAPTPAPGPPTPLPELSFNGTSDASIALPTGYQHTQFLIHASHQGTGGFTVSPVTADGTTEPAVVSATGSYEGTRGVIEANSTLMSLQVRAAGAWSVRLDDASTARSFSTTISGHGDDIVEYLGASTNLYVVNRSTGTSSFTQEPVGGGTVVPIAEGMSGSFSGTAHVEQGPAFFVIVDPDGEWTLTAQ